MEENIPLRKEKIECNYIISQLKKITNHYSIVSYKSKNLQIFKTLGKEQNASIKTLMTNG